MIQVVVEARDRASSGQANTAHTTIIVEVRMRMFSVVPSCQDYETKHVSNV